MFAITVVSIIGVVLNNLKKRICFLIWMATNVIWAVYDFRIGAWEQSILFAVYFGLAIWGWFSWKPAVKPFMVTFSESGIIPEAVRRAIEESLRDEGGDPFLRGKEL